MYIKVSPSVIIAALVILAIVVTGRMDLLPAVVSPLMMGIKCRNCKKK